MVAPESRVESFLERLRALEFVTNLDYSPLADRDDIGVDGVLKVETPNGSFDFSVERKNSYLDRAVLNALMVQAKHHTEKRRPLLVFARMFPPLQRNGSFDPV